MAKRRRRRRRRGRRRRWGLRILAGGAALVVAATALPLLVLRYVPPPTTAFILRSRWADPATGLPCPEIAWRWAPREEISNHLALAVVVAEDQRFFEHRGIDVKQIRRALRERQREGRVRGASTLTQQLVKNLFLWPDASYVRKAVEAWLALSMEVLWPKRRILEVYLNVVQFGPCTFGAAAAAERYFERTPAELTPEQAALLATVLPSPKKLRAHDPGPYAQERTQEILGLMKEHAWLRRRL